MSETQTLKIVKQPTTTEDLRRMSPSKFTAMGIVNFPNPTNPTEIVSGKFEIFDGVAFGTAIINGKPCEVLATYPLQKLVNLTATNMKANIRAHLKISEDRDVTIFEIMSSYARFKILK